MSLDPKEAVRRLKAFEDFYALGINRSVDQLFKTYVKLARDNHDAQREIPTRNRQTLYDWAREDNWYEKARDREEADIAKSREYFDSVRRRTYETFAAMAEDAVAGHWELMGHGVKDEVRLKAITEFYDRFGIVSQKGKQAVSLEPEPEPAKTTSDQIDPSADNAEIIRWLKDRVEERD